MSKKVIISVVAGFIASQSFAHGIVSRYDGEVKDRYGSPLNSRYDTTGTKTQQATIKTAVNSNTGS